MEVENAKISMDVVGLLHYNIFYESVPFQDSHVSMFMFLQICFLYLAEGDGQRP